MMMTMRIALKLAYDGTKFYGNLRQPGKRTVEGELLRVLLDTGMLQTVEDAKFSSASRTDKGVSAIGNVVAFNTSARVSDVISVINAKVDDCWCYAGQIVNDKFDPRRHAKARWYRYLIWRSAATSLDLSKMREAANLFVGTHDFRHFCKYDGRPTVCTINSIIIHSNSEFIIVDTRAAHFLWKQVRKIISALVKVAKGEVAMEDVKRALQPTNVQEPVFDFGILPPEALILMDVTYEFEFQLYTHAIDKIYHELVTRLESISYRREFLNQLLAIACRR